MAINLRTLPVALASAAWALVIQATVRATTASAQEATTTAAAGSATQPAGPQDSNNDPGGDFASPMRLFQLMSEYKTAPGNGAVKGTTREVTTDTAKLRFDYKINLAPEWGVALRADLPFRAKDPLNSSNPSGDYAYGVGDVDVQAALIRQINSRWAAGFGARLYAPTGDDVIGSGKWQIMPIVGARYDLPELSKGSYFEPLLRYDQSFAGDPSKKSISNLQFAPSLNIGLPDRWFFTLYPSNDIRWNFGPPATGQTGRLFLPFDARIGRKLSNNMALSLEVGVPIIKEYPVYDFKTQVRLNINY